MKKLPLFIKGMHCPSCEMLIKDSLQKQKGIGEVEISHETGVAVVHFDEKKVDENTIKTVVEAEGYEVE